MNTSVAPTPWSRAAGVAPSVWRFGRAVEGDGAPSIEWLLKRNCSITPKQLFAAFAGIELLLVGTALLIYARHATDQERITLAGEALSVEHQHGPQTERSEFRAAWVRVEPLSSDRSLIEVAGDGHTARIGRYLRPELRQSLAQELRAALRAHRRPAANNDIHEETATKRP